MSMLQRHHNALYPEVISTEPGPASARTVPRSSKHTQQGTAPGQPPVLLGPAGQRLR
jgi:hypothetical protein